MMKRLWNAGKAQWLILDTADVVATFIQRSWTRGIKSFGCPRFVLARISTGKGRLFSAKSANNIDLLRLRRFFAKLSVEERVSCATDVVSTVGVPRTYISKTSLQLLYL